MMAALYGKLRCLNHLIAKDAIVNAQDDKVSHIHEEWGGNWRPWSCCGPAELPPRCVALSLACQRCRDTGLCLATRPLWLTRVCAPAPSWQYKRTALHWAAFYGKPSCVASLLDANADPRLKSKVSREGRARGEKGVAMELAKLMGHVGVVRLFDPAAADAMEVSLAVQ